MVQIGKKRIFKNINDLDYKKLLELYIDNQDITDSESMKHFYMIN